MHIRELFETCEHKQTQTNMEQCFFGEDLFAEVKNTMSDIVIIFCTVQLMFIIFFILANACAMNRVVESFKATPMNIVVDVVHTNSDEDEDEGEDAHSDSDTM